MVGPDGLVVCSGNGLVHGPCGSLPVWCVLCGSALFLTLSEKQCDVSRLHYLLSMWCMEGRHTTLVLPRGKYKVPFWALRGDGQVGFAVLLRAQQTVALPSWVVLIKCGSQGP